MQSWAANGGTLEDLNDGYINVDVIWRCDCLWDGKTEERIVVALGNTVGSITHCNDRHRPAALEPDITDGGTDMDPCTAVMIAEGAKEADEATQIEAWQRLIDTGWAWSLQGWFGRQASRLIDEGICHLPHSSERK